jgi:peptidyl-prolyl cis-trans isomerase A (cyclophilin A)
MRFRLALAALAALAIAGCGARRADTPPQKEGPPPVPAPETFKVKFETTQGDFTLQVNRSWAPIGVDRFHELVQAGFYDNSKFFRVVPNFVVQFGLAADPAVTAKWRASNLKDDPPLESNKKGRITFATAGPHTRTTQVFINLRDNDFLDNQGFSAFGEVVEGMSVVEKLYSGYGDNGPNQGRITQMGNAYIEANFPKIDGITKATVVE